MTDEIEKLPIDPKENPNHDDLTYLAKVLNLPSPSTMKKVGDEFKTSLVAAVLAVIIFGIPIVDEVLKKSGVGDNFITLMGMKIIIFVILFYIISKKMQ